MFICRHSVGNFWHLACGTFGLVAEGSSCAAVCTTAYLSKTVSLLLTVLP